MKKNTGFGALISAKCPQCRKGQMFPYAPYDIPRFDRMNPCCSNCGLSFEIEPGFYFGAMFVSYAFSVIIFFVVGFSLYLFFHDPPVLVYVCSTFLTILLLYPLTFRYSRVIFLHLFGGIHYKADDDK
jgi:uncharacterized protein (DUF983 family)